MSTPSRLFQVNRTSYTKHYDIATAGDDGQRLYYAALSAGYSKTPDLVLHEGPGGKGPVVAVSYMFRLESGFKMGFGDPASDSVRWEDMAMETRNASKHSLHMSFGNDGGGGGDEAEAQRKEFVWKRTRSAEVDGEKPKALTIRNFKLLDGETDEILAVFLNKPSFTRCGILQINVDRGKDFDVMVFITCLSLYEKSRRRAHGAPIGKGDSSYLA